MKRRWKWSLLALVLAAAAVFGALSVSADDSGYPDRTPTAMSAVTGTSFDSVTLSDGITESVYYIPAEVTVDKASPNPMATGSYWELYTEDAEKKVWKPSQLILRPGLTAIDGSACELTSGALTVFGKSVTTPNGYSHPQGDNGAIANGGDYGDVAIRIGTGSQYYVLTHTNGWQKAVAAVHTTTATTDTYYYYTDLGGASYAATQAIVNNNAAVELMLLNDVMISSQSPEYAGNVLSLFDLGSSNTDAKLTVYCCHDSKITLDNDTLTLALHAQLTNSNGTATAESGFCAVKVVNGKVDDYVSNTVEAKGGTTVRSYNSSKTYLWADGSADAPVSIAGEFAKVSGYVNIADETTIHNTNTLITTPPEFATEQPKTDEMGDAFVTGANVGAKLTVTGGNVHTLCAFEKDTLSITGGTMYVEIGTMEQTTVIGTGGDVHVKSGTAEVWGEVNDLCLNGSDTGNIQLGGNVSLYAKANSATLTGACKLTVGYYDHQTYGQITNSVTGAADANGCRGTLAITTDSATATPIKVNGTFQAISGVVTMSGDLTVADVSATRKITGGGEYSLVIEGAGDKTALSYEEFSLGGTFNNVTVQNVSISLKNIGVSIRGDLSLENANVDVSGGANIGTQAVPATGTITNGILTLENASVYANFTGDHDAQLHIANNCYSSNGSHIGAQGVYDQLTGRVFTCGDLTIRGTKQGKTDKTATVNGGRTLYGDSGMTHRLTITDDMASATILLSSSYDNNGTYQSAGFSGIVVNDGVNNDTRVSITMETDATLPVKIGSSAQGENLNTALDITGDADTLVALTTLDIYGGKTGVSVKGAENNRPTVTLTGAAGTRQPVTGLTGTGVYAYDAKITMVNYAITSMTGVDAYRSEFHLTDSSVTALSTGMTFQLCKPVTLDAVIVNSEYDGVQITNNSEVTLYNTVNVTAVMTAVQVTQHSTLQNDSGSGTFTSTGNDAEKSIALIAGAYSEVTLDQYTFLAKQSNGQGVKVNNSTANLTYPTGTTGDNLIWGGKNGLYVGTGSTATVTNYSIFGAASISGETVPKAATAAAGGDGATVVGTLRLAGKNAILGAARGLNVQGGTVTNYRSDDGWTDEKNGAAQGSGTIDAGVAADAVGLYNGGGCVTLGGYLVKTEGASGASHGVHAYGGSTDPHRTPLPRKTRR